MTIEIGIGAADNPKGKVEPLLHDGEPLRDGHGNEQFIVTLPGEKPVIMTTGEEFYSLLRQGLISLPHSGEQVIDEFPDTPLQEAVDKGYPRGGLPDTTAGIDLMTGRVAHERRLPGDDAPIDDETRPSRRSLKPVYIIGTVVLAATGVIAGGLAISNNKQPATQEQPNDNPNTQPSVPVAEQTPGTSPTDIPPLATSDPETNVKGEHATVTDAYKSYVETVPPELKQFAEAISPDAIKAMGNDLDQIALASMTNKESLQGKTPEQAAQYLADKSAILDNAVQFEAMRFAVEHPGSSIDEMYAHIAETFTGAFSVQLGSEYQIDGTVGGDTLKDHALRSYVSAGDHELGLTDDFNPVLIKFEVQTDTVQGSIDSGDLTFETKGTAWQVHNYEKQTEQMGPGSGTKYMPTYSADSRWVVNSKGSKVTFTAEAA